MKKFIIILCLLMVGKVSPAEELRPISDTQKEQQQIVLTGNLVFDWLDISQIDRDRIIQQYENELFGENTVLKYDKKEFKTEYKSYLKDDDYKRHYMLVKNGVTETDDEKLCGFYKGDLLIVYAVQNKNNLHTVYYYDALGHLKYIDKLSENYPNFPYTSKQYRVNGILISAIYFMSHDLQYMYNNDKSFNGVWYKDKMFNRHAKQVLTRSNW